ncbi:MAG: 3'-5' exonuclease [Ottowia sp.]|uniref:3'-5' exonuclease n=1 Tax=Ottowia sp. TaxID=1898956 RepID=UPI003C718BB5
MTTESAANLPDWVTCNLPIAQGIKGEIDRLCNLVHDSSGDQKLSYLMTLAHARDRLRNLGFRWSHYLRISDLSDLGKFMRSQAIKVEREIGVKFSVAQKPVGRANALFVDTETTGLGLDDEPISLAAVLTEIDCTSGRVVQEIASYHGFREPHCKISPGAFAVHGITKASLSGKEFDLMMFVCLFQSANICIAHNASFDARMIHRILPRDSYTAQWACSCWDVEWPSLGNRKLDTISEALGIHRTTPHDAMADVRTMMNALQLEKHEGGTYLLSLLSRASAARKLASF